MLDLSLTSIVLPSAITACPFGPLGPSCKVVRDQTCASALIAPQVSGSVVCRGLFASPLHPWRPVAPGGGDGPVARRSGAWKNVAKCFENLPAFLRKDFRNLLPRFARGGTTIARHCDFLSPLDPFLGSLAYRRVSVVTACFCVVLCRFIRGTQVGVRCHARSFADRHCVTHSLVFRRQALCYP